MLNFILYASASVIWGSTWLAIKLQLSQVPPILSVSYRFSLAALILLAYSMLMKKKLSFSLKDHGFMALQGFSLFGLSYCSSYLATSYLTSGLVAVVYATILMWNILNLYIFMSQRIAWKAFMGGLVGFSGIFIVFMKDLLTLTVSRSLVGFSIALLGAYLSSIGNVVGARNSLRGIPVTQSNAFAMAYGGILTLVIHFAAGGSLSMSWTIGYMAPLLYLSIFGSVIAFGCYMLLITRIGAAYAAYVTLLMPIIALFLSTLFEGYRLTANSMVGITMVLIGNLMILVPQPLLQRFRNRFLAYIGK